MIYWDAFLILLREGMSVPDIAALALRLNVGLFFAVSGYNKLTCPICHNLLWSNFRRSNIPLCGGFTIWWVAGWEFLAGAALALGWFTGAAAFILFIVCVVAFIVSHKRKLEKRNPVHLMDAITEYFIMFDLMLAVMLLAIMAIGPGAYSLNNYLGYL